MTERKLYCAILLITILIISSCERSPDCSRKEVFCAAFVTDTRGLHDFGLNQDTWAGLENAKAAGMLDQIANIESVDARDYEKNIAFFAEAGYDVILTAGTGMQAATLHSADLYPDSVFIGINQSDEESKTNFISVLFSEDQMGFLAGVIAARLTDMKIVGAVCETSGIDSMWRYCEGFRAGVNYADKSVKVNIVYRDDGSRNKLFNDPEWAYDKAQQLIRQGTDVIFAVGGETALGALRAANDAQVHAIGAERDQREVLGSQGLSVVTSLLGRTSFTVEELMRRVKDGNPADAKTSPVGYVPFDANIPHGLIIEVDQVLSDLANGEIKTNVTIKK